MLTGAFIALAGVLLGAALVTKTETKREAKKEAENTPYNNDETVIVPIQRNDDDGWH
jgi:hypothetical protein